MKNKRLYVSDLDGTLLTQDATLSQYSREQLTRLLQDGLPFTVASARSVYSMREVLNDIPITLPVIELNGACISDLHTGRHLHMETIDSDLTGEIHEVILRHGLDPFLSGYDGKFDFLAKNETYNEGMDWYMEDRRRCKDPRLSHILETKSALHLSILTIVTIDREPAIRDLYAEIKEKFGDRLHLDFFENRYSRGWYWLAIHDLQATKQDSIRVLLEMQNCPMENLVVFGDYTNDVGMFEMAPHAIAVANAHEEIHRLSTETIGDHNEDAVVRYLCDAFENSRNGNGTE